MQHRSRFLALTATLIGLMTLFVAGCNKPSEVTGTPAPATTVGTILDDSVVTANVKAALLADAEIKSFDFKVETRKGDVQLSGFVDNQAQLDRAIAITYAVAGVKSLQNNVSLKGAPATVGNKVDDSIVTTKVKAALLSEASIKSLDIAVVTRKGEVQLSGFVDNQGQMDRAIAIAGGIKGVSRVANEMSLKK